jgi:succinate dehydrogenase membrane anchor subunit
MSAPGIQGLRPWVIQRISAVVIAVFVIYFAAILLFDNPLTESGWSVWVAQPVNNIGLSLFLLAVLWHAWIGIRDIVLDYIHNVVIRMLALTLVVAVLLGSGFWGVKTLFLVVIN